MNNWKKVVMLSSLCSCALSVNAFASTNLETGFSLAGMSVALNNYYAGNMELEKQLVSSYSDIQNRSTQSNTTVGSIKSGSGNGQGSGNKSSDQPGSASEDAARAKAVQETVSNPKSSTYDNVAVPKINGTINIRTKTNTSSGVTGKIDNGCAAAIPDTVDGEGGKWCRTQSGSVTGYIKADYLVAGQQAEARVKQVGTTYGTMAGTPSLHLRQSPDMEGRTLTLLSEGAHYMVTGEEGDFPKVQVDSDLEDYVFKKYMKTGVESSKAVSVEEERAKAAEEVKRRENADEVLKALEGARKADAAKETTAATTKAQKTMEAPTATAPKREETKGTDAVTTIVANPEDGKDSTVIASTMAKAPETVDSKGPRSSGGASTEVASATRNVVVVYAKQFLGNPYIYGGMSLTSGTNCSGFTQNVLAHFGISIGRSFRSQAARGKSISANNAKSGDLLFYASGDYISHVTIYIDNGQVIHANNPTTDICITSANYGTPCKVVTFLDQKNYFCV